MITPKPPWIRSSFRCDDIKEMEALMNGLQLNTVCREANCPNRGECFRHKTATFMILGRNCTRHCRFCNVSNEKPSPVDPLEPQHLTDAILRLNLRHSVITSVTRDDLPDYGAGQFAAVTRAVKTAAPSVTVELLIPDFQGDESALKTVLDAGPDVLGHNLETVPRLYRSVRPEAKYERSLAVLKMAKRLCPSVIVKTGIMVGLGETEEEVTALMKDALAHDCDFLTIGQYLQPSSKHLPVTEYVTPEQFDRYAVIAKELGFKSVMSGPMVRSSYHASEMIGDK